VLVKIISPKIQSYYKDENGEDMPYLLQVWSKKGEMVFQRKLRTQLTNWSINQNVLVFQEDASQLVIFAVVLNPGYKAEFYEI